MTPAFNSRVSRRGRLAARSSASALTLAREARSSCLTVILPYRGANEGRKRHKNDSRGRSVPGLWCWPVSQLVLIDSDLALLAQAGTCTRKRPSTRTAQQAAETGGSLPRRLWEPCNAAVALYCLPPLAVPLLNRSSTARDPNPPAAANTSGPHLPPAACHRNRHPP
jgi:hypothetical protein